MIIAPLATYCLCLNDSSVHSVKETHHNKKKSSRGIKQTAKTSKGESTDGRTRRGRGADKGGVMEGPSPGCDTASYCNSFCHSPSLSSLVPSLSVPVGFVPTRERLSNTLFGSTLTHLLYHRILNTREGYYLFFFFLVLGFYLCKGGFNNLR